MTTEEMWRAYRAASSDDGGLAYSSWHFCDNQTDADELADLVVSGGKRATAGALWSYEAEGEPLPKVGDHSVITDWSGQARAVIRTTSVEVVPFAYVTADFAVAEGEGDLSLEYWRRAHWAAFSRESELSGREPTEDMPVVCERFDVVFVDPSPRHDERAG